MTSQYNWYSAHLNTSSSAFQGHAVTLTATCIHAHVRACMCLLTWHGAAAMLKMQVWMGGLKRGRGRRGLSICAALHLPFDWLRDVLMDVVLCSTSPRGLQAFSLMYLGSFPRPCS